MCEMFMHHLKAFPLPEVSPAMFGFDSDFELFAQIMKLAPPVQNMELRKKVNILVKIKNDIIKYLSN